MAPIALTSSLTSPPGLPVKKSPVAAATKNQGISLEGDSTPYSATSTAVSEDGDDKHVKVAPPSPGSSPRETIDESLPRIEPGQPDYYTRLLASSAPVPSTKAGTVVYGSAIQVLEALAAKHSDSVWVYDDAAQVGFGLTLSSWNLASVHSVQTRQGAGLELAGYARKSKSDARLSVFATTATLSYLLPNLSLIQGNVVVHLATTEAKEDLTLGDSLSGEIVKALSGLPEEWDTVFSSFDTVEVAGKIYGREGKIIHVVESAHSAREIASYTFPAPSTGTIGDFTLSNPSASEITLALNGSLAATISSGQASLILNTLSPSPDALAAAISGKTVTLLGTSTSETNTVRTALLSALYAASGSSKSQWPTLKAIVAPARSPDPEVAAKIVSFYTAPLAPLPQLLTQLFLSSPSLHTRLAQFGSASARGLKSVLSLSPSTSSPHPVSSNPSAFVTWVSDANVLKSTDVLSSAAQGGILVLELPWTEEEVPLKLSRGEIETIKSKQLRVFLLDLDPSASTLPTKETVAFLLLYTGSQRLPNGIRKVLDAFHSGHLGREDVEDAQAGLSELDVSAWEVPELEEGKTEKVKSAWEWDALPGQAGVVSLDQDAKPVQGPADLAARHLLFREAFAFDDESPSTLDPLAGPAINALRPSESESTYLATVSENRRLTPLTYDRNVFHLELDTTGTGLKYEIGEALGIHGWNDAAEVMEFCSWYGLDPDSLVSFPSPIRAGAMETRTVFQLLQQNLDLFGRPGKAFYASLAKLATSKADAMTLKFISAPEGADLFKRMADKETVTFADVLFKFRTARPSIEELVGLIPEIKPRHYSIASSQKAVGDKVELLIVTVDWINSKGSPRFGQCTRYLAALKPGDKVTVSIKPSVMKLPPLDKQPVIMSGLGTGAAPFRAFMQHRAWQRSQGIDVGPLLYYFGSRHRSQEYLYGEEIEAYISSGIISHAGLAFSRDGPKKVYIQHKIKEDAALLADMLTAKGENAAYFYLCGPTWPVPDVFEALVGSLQETKGMKRDEAESFVDALKEEERYVLEVY
ncbi:hypothetical protein BD324DRAFT_641823 [Kockovaella imperatae]|uniref:assimilatory sulfite reductase (NADPH) n=1 Tax=Kockovaella imperatae TaxID=4999 RepID=A0A1Y1UHZ4_9TREE|nr:hypothetical protein BD324DRAFT_641823 [Kockovaella imperatae]ORX37683.1 hypothetical protein BD324DRAFT_641823 [Kockovaella imperatae]